MKRVGESGKRCQCMVCPIVVSADGKKQRYKQTNYIDYITTGVTGIIGAPSAKKFAVVLRILELQPYYVCTTVQVHNMVYSMYYVYMVTKKREKKVTV